MEFMSAYLVAAVSIFNLLVIMMLWQQDKAEMRKERKDLYDRIMSRNLTEYKEVTAPEPNELPIDDKDVVDLDSADARADLLGEEDEDQHLNA